MKFFGNVEEIFGKCLKKSFKNFVENLAPRFWNAGSASGTAEDMSVTGTCTNQLDNMEF